MTSDITPSTTAAESADTPLLEVVSELDELGFDGQFRAVEGSAIQCLTCRTTFPAGDAGSHGSTRLEGESDPADMILVVPVECPHCTVAGSLVLSYGPDAPAEDADVVVALDRTRL